MDGQMPESRALTTRSIVIGAIGSIILTASSLYMALRMGALPFPIVFAALTSVLILRAFGSTNLHEANVTHAAMSAGSMVAGGLAFTIPALWISDSNASISLVEILGVSIIGTIVGLIACHVFQPYFIRDKKLPYPIGLSAADTLKATTQTGAKQGKALFGGMGVAALWALLRDTFGLLPQVLFSSGAFPGVAFGVMNSPMILSLGFIIGTTMAGVWFLGSLIGNFGIVVALPALGICSVEVADAIRKSVGLGLMLGVGFGVVFINIYDLIRAKKNYKSQDSLEKQDIWALKTPKSYTALISCGCVALACIFFNLNLLASIILIAATWFCIWLSGWLTGTTGVNPMEIFGVIVLLLLQAIFHEAISIKVLFMCAGVVAVGCGVCGDVMNDLKAGDVLQTNPRDQFAGMLIGGLIGSVISALVLTALHTAYGSGAFGPESMFVSTQANVVATMAGGIPHMQGFIAGLIIGCILACLKLPVMTLGLGVYLPFCLSAGAGVGALIKLIFDKINSKKTDEAKLESQACQQAVASGVLGGESLVGVICALIIMCSVLLS